jgi:hypothetical protein
LVLAALIVAGMTFASCGGDDGGATPTAFVPEATVDAGPPGLLEGNTFTSVARNYRITFPEGWRADEAFAVTPLFIIDAFLGPNDGTPVEPNLTMTCNQLQGQTPEQFVENKRLFASSFAENEIVDEQQVMLAGEPALRLAYTQQTGTVALRKVEVHQARGSCGWSAVLTSDPSRDYTREFQAAVDSLEFLG